MEAFRRGLITDDNGDKHLARITILIVLGSRRNVLSATLVVRKRIVSIFNFNNLRLEAADIAVPLRGEDDGLQPFKLGLSSDGYAEKELVVNSVVNSSVAPAAGPTLEQAER